MTKSTSNYERLKQARLEKLGTNDPICGMCGDTNWWRIQLHHPGSQIRDDGVVLICANCHCDVTQDQKDHPEFDPSADPLLDKIGHFLVGLADMLKYIVERLYEFGHALIKRAASPAGELG